MITCRGCGNSFKFEELTAGFCWACDLLARQDSGELSPPRMPQGAVAIMLTTEMNAPWADADRLGIVSGDCVFGMHLFKDLFVAIRDVVGGRSNALQKALREARNTALDEMRQEAFGLGATAVVGIKVETSDISGSGGTMIMVVATGTAVRRTSGALHPAIPPVATV